MSLSGIQRHLTNRLSFAAFPSIPFNGNQGRMTIHFGNPLEKLPAPFLLQHKMWTTPLSLPMKTKSFESKRVDLMDRQVFASAHDDAPLTGSGLKTAAFVLLMAGLSGTVLAEEESWGGFDEPGPAGGLLGSERGLGKALRARQKELDSFLEAVWPRIVRQIPWPWSMFVPKCTNAAQMRRWLDGSIGERAAGSISHLDLKGLSLKELPPEIKKFKGLTSLNLSHNNLSSLEGLCHLSQLETLIVNFNHVAEIPESIGELKQLKDLRLGSNWLETIPKTIGSLTRLERLTLKHNQLKSLPETIGELTSLTKLSLQYNRLDQLPEEFAKLSQLEELVLNNNQLTEFPDAVCKLSCLKILNLGNNKLSQLPAAIGGLRSLTRLDLRDNKLTTLPDEMVALDQLERLNVERNPLTKISDKIQAMPSLKYLYWRKMDPQKNVQSRV